MKKIMFALALLLPGISSAASFTGYDTIPGDVVSFATEVVDFSPVGIIPAPNDKPEYALGAPNYYTQTSQRIVNLNGGSMVLGFSPYVMKADGTSESEVYVYEAGWYETWDTYASNDLVNWVKLTPSFKGIHEKAGSVIGYDLDEHLNAGESYKYIKIVDISGGVDLDAVVVTHGRSENNFKYIDSASCGRTVYDLIQDPGSQFISVKVIDEENKVSYVPFVSKSGFEPLAVSVNQGKDCVQETEINVMALDTKDGTVFNILKDATGKDVKQIDNSTVF